MTLHSMLGIIKLQALVRGQKVRASCLGLEVNTKFSQGKAVVKFLNWVLLLDTTLASSISRIYYPLVLVLSIQTLPLVDYEKPKTRCIEGVRNMVDSLLCQTYYCMLPRDH